MLGPGGLGVGRGGKMRLDVGRALSDPLVQEIHKRHVHCARRTNRS